MLVYYKIEHDGGALVLDAEHHFYSSVSVHNRSHNIQNTRVYNYAFLFYFTLLLLHTIIGRIFVNNLYSSIAAPVPVKLLW